MEEVRKPIRKSEAGRWAGRALFFFVLGFVLYLFLHSPFFAIETVEVLGASLLSPEEVARIGGVDAGQNLLRLDTERVRRRLVEDPRIGAARVRRVPPGRLVVEIEERMPVALVPYADGFLFVDRSGRLLAADRRSRPGLPIVTGVPLAEVGLHLPPPEPLIVAAEVAARLPARLREEVAEIHVADPEDVLVLTRRGQPIFLGEAADLDRKLLVAESLLDKVPDGARGALDVRIPSAPTLRN